MKERSSTKTSTGQRLPGGRQLRPAMARGERGQDAIALLKADHREVADMVESFEKARGADKASLARQIAAALTVHARIEEELLYPQAREALDQEDRDLIDEAEVEHASIKQLVAEIERGTPDHEHFDARVKVVGEYVQHHVKEEERKLFPLLRKAKLDLKELGAQLATRKAELASEIEEGPKPSRH